MDSEMEWRINRLLSSIEREKVNGNERPTGDFVRQMFEDENDSEQTKWW